MTVPSFLKKYWWLAMLAIAIGISVALPWLKVFAPFGTTALQLFGAGGVLFGIFLAAIILTAMVKLFAAVWVGSPNPKVIKSSKPEGEKKPAVEEKPAVVTQQQANEVVNVIRALSIEMPPPGQDKKKIEDVATLSVEPNGTVSFKTNYDAAHEQWIGNAINSQLKLEVISIDLPNNKEKGKMYIDPEGVFKIYSNRISALPTSTITTYGPPLQTNTTPAPVIASQKDAERMLEHLKDLGKQDQQIAHWASIAEVCQVPGENNYKITSTANSSFFPKNNRVGATNTQMYSIMNELAVYLKEKWNDSVTLTWEKISEPSTDQFRYVYTVEMSPEKILDILSTISTPGVQHKITY
jgi:hypothetical protein